MCQMQSINTHSWILLGIVPPVEKTPQLYGTDAYKILRLKGCEGGKFLFDHLV
jgi:hypothetical protein